MNINKTRREDIDLTKAIGIILVAYGHFGGMVEQPFWYQITKEVIYTFHMPLFMMLSGFLFSHFKRTKTFKKNLSDSFRRLIIPYVVFSWIFYSLYNIIQGGQDMAWWQLLLKPLYSPTFGHTTYLWFLPVLFILYFVANIFRKSTPYIGLCIFAFLWLVNMQVILPEYAYILKSDIAFLGYLSYFGVFFFIGQCLEVSIPVKLYDAVFYSVLFIGGLFIMYNLTLCYYQSVALTFFLAIMGSFALWYLMALWVKPSGIRQYCLSIGFNADLIYLLHPLILFPFGYACKLGNIHLLFPLMLIGGLICSVIIPVYLNRKILPYSLVLRYLFGRA